MIVWLASYPRSGNTFFRVILNSIFGIKTYSIYDDKLDIGADEATSDVVGHEFLPDDFDLQKMRDSEEIYVIKTHELPDKNIAIEDKIIYLMRDGRESSLSFWHYSKKYTEYKDDLTAFILQANPKTGFGTWSHHVDAWDPKHRKNTLLIYFEKLVDDPTKYLKAISDFTGIQPVGSRIPTFEELQKINPKFFRSGKKDSWKTQYSQADQIVFWLAHGKQMSAYGYINDRPDLHGNKTLIELQNQHSLEKRSYPQETGESLSPNSKNPLVTIITVAYNAEDAIEKTIQNIIAQTYPNIEYIIIDGGSTDGSLDIIKKYDDKISYWVSEPDDGIYHAMNKAIDIATGEWVNFMNAGDIFVDDNVVLNFIKQIKDTSDICYGSRYVHRGEVATLEETTDIKDFYYKMPFGHQAAFVKNTLLKKYKFDTSYKLSADYDFFIKSYRNNSAFQNLNFPISNFYVGGLSYQFKLKSLLETLKVLSDYTDEATVKKSIYYKLLKNMITKDKDSMANVFIRDNKSSLEFTIQPKSKDVQISFYLFKDNKKIDTQWYSNSFSYKLDKKIFGNGRYRVQYFIINNQEENPGKAEKKETGYSEFIDICTPINPTEKTFLLPTDDLNNYPDKKFCIAEEEHPIMIFQVGKVGSSTMAKSLKNNVKNLPVYQIHNIETAEKLLKKENALGYKGGFYHFTTGNTLKSVIQKNPEIRWKVIVGVREPIKRWVSDIFQNINERYTHFYDTNGKVKEQELIEYIYQTLETEPMQVWFDEELKKTFGVDVFQYDFDKTKGYTIIKANNVDILVYRL